MDAIRILPSRRMCALVSILLFPFMMLAAPRAHAAPGDQSPDGVWTRIVSTVAATVPAPAGLSAGASSRLYALDGARLSTLLANTPLEGKRFSTPGTLISLPLADRGFVSFRVYESPILSARIAAEMTGVKTYMGSAVDNPSITVRFDRTLLGFNALVHLSDDLIVIEPAGTGGLYRTYRREELEEPPASVFCKVGNEGADLQPEQIVAAPPQGPTLSEYDLAIAVTGEFTQFYGGIVAARMRLVTVVNELNAIYEPELAIRFKLVCTAVPADTLNDRFTTPYNITGTLLDQSNAALNDSCASTGWDIGHLLQASASGGLAQRGTVCGGSKGRGASSNSNPNSVNLVADIMAHEVGHQFNAQHTFNTSIDPPGTFCGSQRAPTAAYEIGGGSTIMAYNPGRCGIEGINEPNDFYFHTFSFDEITNFRDGGAAGCRATFASGNAAPTINAGPNFTIPRGTPFTLTATASDPDGDPLSFCWEQMDLGPASPPLNGGAAGPLFRSRPPDGSLSRTFPRLSDLLAGTVSQFEILPTADRTMNFRCTARDNKLPAGGVNYSSMVLTVAGDPFVVTAPNGGETLHAGCSTNVTWTVGGGNVASNVDILYSSNGGGSFSMLLANTANDGSASVQVPCGATTQGRIMVRAVGNVFFDVSNGNFTISSVPPSVAITFTGGTITSGCSVVLPLHAIVTDDCGVTAANTQATVSAVGGAATVVPSLVTTQFSPTEVRIDGTVTVSDLLGCPAEIVAVVEGTDGCGVTTSDNKHVFVNENEPPVVTVTATGGEVGPTCEFLVPFTARVTDNCKISRDNVTVAVTLPTGNATLGVPTVNLVQTLVNQVDITGTVLVSALTSCPAIVNVEVSALDVCGNSGSASDTAEVTDHTPPAIAVTLNREFLWPPNHKLVDIVADVQVTDNCPGVTWVLTSASSNEPENGLGDGDTAPDIVGAATGTRDSLFQVRSERSGRGDGRVYTFVWTATDPCGNSASTTATVRVAHDQQGHAIAAGGFSPDGTTIDPSASVIALLVPSRPLDLSTNDDGDLQLAPSAGAAAGGGASLPLGFDAARLVTASAQLGNTANVIDALNTDAFDADGDGLVDRLLLYSARDARDLLAQAAEQGPVGLHFVNTLGESFLVPDLFGLGPVAMLSSAARARVDDGIARTTTELEGTSSRVAGEARTDAARVSTAAVLTTRLAGIHPNPFFGTTTIAYDLARPGRVRVAVYSPAGRVLRVLEETVVTSGRHGLTWDGRDQDGRRLAPGIYLVRFEGDRVSANAKAILMP